MTQSPANGAKSWAILVPIKELHLAKTRLLPPKGVDRADLALAMALDVITASLSASRVNRVIAITNDQRARNAVNGLGADIVDDDPDAGLNPALEHAQAHARSLGSVRVAAVSSDLAALTGAALDVVLGHINEDSRAFIRDASGEGTALLAAAGVPLHPNFGPDSAAAHARSGAIDLTDAALDLVSTSRAGLRRDVDTIADLLDAQEIGVGHHTSAILASAILAEVSMRSHVSGGARVSELSHAGQATVRTWDETTGALTAVRDDGTLLEIGPEAFLSSPLLRLRPGQRIRLESRNGVIVRVSLPTM